MLMGNKLWVLGHQVLSMLYYCTISKIGVPVSAVSPNQRFWEASLLAHAHKIYFFLLQGLSVLCSPLHDVGAITRTVGFSKEKYKRLYKKVRTRLGIEKNGCNISTLQSQVLHANP